MMRFLKASLVIAIVFASLVVAALARAAGPQADIRVRVIHAHAGKKKMDPKLADLEKFLTQHKFDTYTQLIDETLTLGLDPGTNTQGIGLLSGRNLNVTLTGLTAEKASVHVLLVGRSGKILDTDVKAGPHKLFFIAIKGPVDDGVLFLSIEPHYDPAALGPAVSSANVASEPAKAIAEPAKAVAEPKHK